MLLYDDFTGLPPPNVSANCCDTDSPHIRTNSIHALRYALQSLYT